MFCSASGNGVVGFLDAKPDLSALPNVTLLLVRLFKWTSGVCFESIIVLGVLCPLFGVADFLDPYVQGNLCSLLCGYLFIPGSAAVKLTTSYTYSAKGTISFCMTIFLAICTLYGSFALKRLFNRDSTV